MTKESKEVEEGKIFAFLGVFLSIIGFAIVLLAKKDNKYAMYYAKQGLVLFVAYVIVVIVSAVLRIIPLIENLIGNLLLIGIIILWLIGFINALSGKEKPIPIIGQYAKYFKI